MRIGIYGGTFDPVHNGHISFAEKAIHEAGLERVIITAEKNPYRKRPHVSWDHRQAMIERATERVMHVDHDYEFANQLAHKHTMTDILATAQHYYGKEHEFWFLVGSDTFEHMHKWTDLAETDLYGGFVVALRQDQSESWVKEHIARLQSVNQHLHYVLVSNMYTSVSSSKVRQQVSQGILPEDVSESVAAYITDHNLYSS